MGQPWQADCMHSMFEPLAIFVPPRIGRAAAPAGGGFDPASISAPRRSDTPAATRTAFEPTLDPQAADRASQAILG